MNLSICSSFLSIRIFIHLGWILLLFDP